MNKLHVVRIRLRKDGLRRPPATALDDKRGRFAHLMANQSEVGTLHIAFPNTRY